MSDFDDNDNENENDDDILIVTATADEAGQRLDRWLAARCEGLSRTRLQKLIGEGAVMAGGAVAGDPAAGVLAGVTYSVILPPPLDDTPVAENIPLTIIYEDADLLVIDKPAGLVVHPAPGHRSGTLVNALLHHCGESLSGIGGVRRPGIVHRLDKDTSGLMLAAKNDRAHRGLSAQLADRSLSRRYTALIWGVPSPRKGQVNEPIGRHHIHRQKMTVTKRGGRDALTFYEVQEKFHDAAALVECTLATGRTHQIRVHMAHIGFPLIGDPVYGLQPTAAQAALRRGGITGEAVGRILSFPRQALHACAVRFIHPTTGEAFSFNSAPPPDLQELISLLKQ